MAGEETAVIETQDLLATAPAYLLSQGGGQESCDMNGIAYFMAVFQEVEAAANKLQYGATNLTEAMEEVTRELNDAKDAQLKADNDAINAAIQNAAQYQNDTDDHKFEEAQSEVTAAQNQYNVDNSSYSSILQAMSPITTADSDLTTTISKNNSMLIQMATYIIQIIQNFAQNLLRAA